MADPEFYACPACHATSDGPAVCSEHREPVVMEAIYMRRDPSTGAPEGNLTFELGLTTDPNGR